MASLSHHPFRSCGQIDDTNPPPHTHTSHATKIKDEVGVSSWRLKALACTKPGLSLLPPDLKPPIADVHFSWADAKLRLACLPEVNGLYDNRELRTELG